jgi:hypothetical protein
MGINVPFEEDDIIILRHIPGTEFWSENPNIAMNMTTNRLKFRFSIYPSPGTPSPYLNVSCIVGTYGDVARWGLSITSAKISYIWKELFNANPLATWYAYYAFYGAPTFGGNQAFKSMEVGSVSSSSTSSSSSSRSSSSSSRSSSSSSRSSSSSSSYSLTMDNGTFSPAANGDGGYRWYSSDVGIYVFVGTQIKFGDQTLYAYGTTDGFVRFTNVTIPQGATITKAIVTLTAVSSKSGASCKIQLAFNNTNNATAPTNLTQMNSLINSGLTTTKVSWVVPATTANNTFDTPDIKSTLQTVISRAGWVSGNALVLVFKDNSSDGAAYRDAKPFGAGQASIYIEWGT